MCVMMLRYFLGGVGSAAFKIAVIKEQKPKLCVSSFCSLKQRLSSFRDCSVYVNPGGAGGRVVLCLGSCCV